MADISNYEKIRKDAEQYYRSLAEITCPALQETVFFSSGGFNHIVYKNHRNERDRSSQIMRFKLLARAEHLIRLTTTYQEHEETIQQVHVKKHKQKVCIAKPVHYWGLIAIIDNRKIKVILRKVGNGHLCFWSIVPAWVTNKIRDQKYISTMKGNPEED